MTPASLPTQTRRPLTIAALPLVPPRTAGSVPDATLTDSQKPFPDSHAYHECMNDTARYHVRMIDLKMCIQFVRTSNEISKNLEMWKVYRKPDTNAQVCLTNFTSLVM